MLILLILFFSLNINSSYSKEIDFNLETNSDINYNYYLLRLNSPPDTLFVSLNDNINRVIKFKNVFPLPMAVALHISGIDGKSDHVITFEIDSSYLSVSLDLKNNDFSIVGSDFQNKFTDLKLTIKKLQVKVSKQLLSPNDFRTEVSDLFINFLENNINHPISYYLINGFINQINDNKLIYVKNIVNSSEIDNYQTKLLMDLINESLKKRFTYKIGDEITTLDSLIDSYNKEKTVDLSKGEYIIYVWSTWCGPCIEKLDKFNNLKVKPSDTKMIFISIDNNKQKWENFLAKKKYNFVSYYSIGSKILEVFNVDKLPFIIKIKNGIVEEIEPEITKYFEN